VKFIYYYIILLALLVHCDDVPIDSAESSKVSENRKILSDPTFVHLTKAKSGQLDYLINSSGTVFSLQSIGIKSKSTGIINQLMVENGKHVIKGKTLFTTENEKEKIAMERARINLKEFKLKYENELISYDNTKNSADINPTIIENLKLSSGLNRAILDLQEAKNNYKNTITKAAFSGTISNLKITKGAFINFGDNIADLSNMDKLGIKVSILEVDYPLIDIGQEAIISPIGQPKNRLKGKIHNINPAVDQESGLVNVTIKLSNKSPHVIPGMHAEVSIKIPSSSSILVPKSAIVIRTGREVVFTYEDGLAKWNYVKTGKENGKEIEIIEGLEEGVIVITDNNLQLAHDAPVKSQK